eukprot:1145200-Lingulodinium_polyedra.AAC.1
MVQPSSVEDYPPHGAIPDHVRIAPVQAVDLSHPNLQTAPGHVRLKPADVLLRPGGRCVGADIQ